MLLTSLKYEYYLRKVPLLGEKNEMTERRVEERESLLSTDLALKGGRLLRECEFVMFIQAPPIWMPTRRIGEQQQIVGVKNSTDQSRL